MGPQTISRLLKDVEKFKERGKAKEKINYEEIRI